MADLQALNNGYGYWASGKRHSKHQRLWVICPFVDAAKRGSCGEITTFFRKTDSQEVAMRGKAIIFMTLLVVLMASVSFAAVCPEVTTLGALYDGAKFKPLRIAVGPDGNTYVTDAKNDTVALYDYAGKQIKSIGVESPLGIAVDDAGTVYVGSGEGRGAAYIGNMTGSNKALFPIYYVFITNKFCSGFGGRSITSCIRFG